jgi:beta-lactamase superfamily II metal-dependent hydrolase
MVITWNGANYRIVDCGAEGDCLFASMAHVLMLAGQFGNEETIAGLRAGCIDILTGWIEDGVPDWVDTERYETPTEERIGDLLAGDWGDAATILAVLLHRHPTVRATVLWPDGAGDFSDWVIDAAANGFNITTDVYLYWNGGSHYQALEPTDDPADEDDGGEGERDDDSAIEEEEEPPAKKEKGSVSTKLGTGSVLSSGITTIKPVGALEIHLLDVGQGEATLILFAGTVILIDGGRATRGGETVHRHLRKLGIDRIHHMICTHFDSDHVEGLTVLLPLVNVGQVWTPGGLFVGDDERNGIREGVDNKYRDFGEAVIARAEQLSRTMRAGDSIDIGPLHLTCISVGMGEGFVSNNHSIALRVQYYGFCYYTGGDLEVAYENLIIRQMVVGKGHVCAMKCGHHGSSGSTSAWMLKKTRPTVALISCGKHSYCHPDDLLVDRLCTAKSIQNFYLTNCCYNRAGINPQYAVQLKKEQSEWDVTARKRKQDDKKEKRLGTYKPVAVSRPLCGIVAGDAAHLGTIVIRVDGKAATSQPHFFEVGRYDEKSGWVWRRHVCGSKVLKGECKEDHTSLVNIKTLGASEESLWEATVKMLHRVERFSLLTKLPGEKKEKQPLDEENVRHALESESDRSEESESDWEDEGKSRRKQQKKVKTEKGKEEKGKEKDEEDGL